MGWFQRLFHRHEFEDWYVFDSCVAVTVATGEQRVRGQAVMMICTGCDATQRRPLKTWAEAREAQEELGTLHCTPVQQITALADADAKRRKSGPATEALNLPKNTRG